jgi:cytochrome c-type biogenesis protein CcmH
MTFWIIATGAALILAFFLFRTLVSPLPQDENETQLAIYKDQLSEIERDEARRTLTQNEAKRLRTEVSRRILSADDAQKVAPKSMSPTEVAVVVAIVLVTLLGGGLWTYSSLGVPGYDDLPRAERFARAAEMLENRATQDDVWNRLSAEVLNDAEGKYADLVKKLRETVEKRPDDIEGHRILVGVETGLENYRAALRAQQRILEIQGGQAQAQDFFEYGQLMIFASGMYVSPEAETALRAALARDPANEGALYYMGLMMMQNDRPDVAFSTWRRLLNEGDPEAPWQQFIRQDIEEVAAMAGAVNFELPAPRLRGPSAQDIEAASEMSAEDREEFIRSMVAQLSDRLATQGGSAAEWARLISSYGILGEVENAKVIWTEAQAVFGSDQAAMDQLRNAAKSAGAIE